MSQTALSHPQLPDILLPLGGMTNTILPHRAGAIGTIDDG
jgi:hypothetical protein